MKDPTSPAAFLLPLHVNDFLASPFVQAMDDQQFRWYFKLLCYAWTNKAKPCHLPADDTQLMIYAGCNNRADWDAKKSLVLCNFDKTEDTNWISNVRLIAEWERVLQIHEKRAALGKKGAEKRWSIDSQGIAELKPSHSQAIADDSTQTKTQTKTNTKSKPLVRQKSDDEEKDPVEEIRKAHPRGAEKAINGRKAIQKAIAYVQDRHRLGKLEAARYLFIRTKAFRKATDQWPESDRQFIPMCASWFNSGAFDDPDEAWVRKPKIAPAQAMPPKMRDASEIIREMEAEREEARRRDG